MEREEAVLFSHRERACNDACEARVGPGMVGFFNLDTWLVYVLNNLRPNLDEARGRAERLADFF